MDDLTSAFAPCASLRLFFPDMLSAKYRRLIYVDTDVMLLGDVARLWESFEIMEREGRDVGMVSENLDPRYTKISYQKRVFLKSPLSRFNIYDYSFIPSPPHGLNSGVMLMELRRMRRKRWRQKVLAAYSTLRRHLAFVDQVRKEIFL